MNGGACSDDGCKRAEAEVKPASALFYGEFLKGI